MLTKKDKKKRYNKSVKSRGHSFSGTWMTDQTEAAFGKSSGGAISGLVGAASAGIDAGMQNAELVGVEEAQADIDARKNFTSTASTNNDLLAEMASATNTKADFDFKDFMQDGKTLAMNTINATMQGAASGASAGPWGAVAGAAAGLLGGVGGIIGGRVKAGVEAAKKKEAARRANMAQAQALAAKAGALDQAADARSLAAYYADGGAINPFPSSEFGSPITEFNAGGSHEENPYDGIPQGIAPDGLPNLVEEGEVKYNNYIFSDRLMLTKQDKKKYKFLKGKTYADAAKAIKRELGIDERPNDLIAKTDLEEQLNLLSTLQEEERAKRGLRGENRMMYAKGGHIFNGNNPVIYINPETGQPFTVFSSAWTPVGNTSTTQASIDDFMGKNPGFSISDKYEVVPEGTEGAIQLPQYRIWRPRTNSALQIDNFNGSGYLDYTNLSPSVGKRYKHNKKPIYVKLKSAGAQNGQVVDPVATEVVEAPVETPASVEVVETPAGTQERVETSTQTGQLNGSYSTPPPVTTVDLGKQWYSKDANGIISLNNSISNRRDVLRHRRRSSSVPLYYGQLSKSGDTITEGTPEFTVSNDKSRKEVKNAYNELFNTSGIFDNLIQTAPAIGSAIGTLTSVFDRPTYKHTKRLTQPEKSITPVTYTPTHQDIRLDRFDTNYHANKLAAQAGATRRAIREQTSSNPYTATAALLSADANAQSQMGDLYRKAAEYNQGIALQEAQFNEAGRRADAEGLLKAASANATLRDKALTRQAEKDIYAARLNMAEDQAYDTAVSANITSLFDNLGAMGKEDREFALAAMKIMGEGELTPEMQTIMLPKLQKILAQAGYKYGGKLRKKKGYTI